jgi:preprotein translocase subunit SecA
VPADQQADAPARQPAPRRTQQPLILNEPGNAAALPGGRPRQPEASPFAPKPARTGGDDVIKTVRHDGAKVGRNDPCPCGSGKKYKKCHGASVS